MSSAPRAAAELRDADPVRHLFDLWEGLLVVHDELAQLERKLAAALGEACERWAPLQRRGAEAGRKDGGDERAVPLRRVVLEARDAMPRRIDAPLLFPAPRGGYIDLEIRYREWTPAQLSYLATIMGTSVRELEDTYFRWLRRTDDQLLAVFDAYDLPEAASG